MVCLNQVAESPVYLHGDFTIAWTNHALERAEERFATHRDLSIPNDKIVRISRLVGMGEEYRVKTPRAQFVCKKDRDDMVAVVTVLFSV